MGKGRIRVRHVELDSLKFSLNISEKGILSADLVEISGWKPRDGTEIYCYNDSGNLIQDKIYPGNDVFLGCRKPSVKTLRKLREKSNSKGQRRCEFLEFKGVEKISEIRNSNHLIINDRKIRTKVKICGKSKGKKLVGKIVALGNKNRPTMVNLDGYSIGMTQFIKIPKKGRICDIFNSKINNTVECRLIESEKYKVDNLRDRWVIVRLGKKKYYEHKYRSTNGRFAKIIALPSEC